MKYIILGIDPGSTVTGYGIIEKNFYINSGCIPVKKKYQKNSYYFLRYIYLEINKIIRKFNPNYFVIEEVFIGKNAKNSLKLSQASSAAILSATKFKIPIFQYSIKTIKKIVTGFGNAKKDYIFEIVSKFFSIQNRSIKQDSIDALAVAMTHYFIFLKNKI
ncbi:crossover junction endodeoxyribonuclease RuvC [bacterium endosymbiont of Pedicinus badii]|uniref:crossover junction endodeoxyribonuclease RuvC n=1 Tax=bacterium endosymbiont of Pedicinus badii TaxID=1719126 RepID=UPI0009B94566|nr:crossover junction endodeoxyribonuclease RuvC [bacterium endosymbiont of Pedicinus badii]OQM34430.1 hypothetical protein AOQ89_00885 [bacterium endosymbiont of Pedicinus badii]